METPNKEDAAAAPPVPKKATTTAGKRFAGGIAWTTVLDQLHGVSTIPCDFFQFHPSGAGRHHLSPLRKARAAHLVLGILDEQGTRRSD